MTLLLIWDFISLYSYYLLAAIILRFIMTLFPESLTEGFDNTVLGMRRGLVNGTERIFKTDNNFEVLVSSRIFVPFFVFMFMDVGLTQLDHFMTIMTLRVFLFILHLFIIINVIPRSEDLIPLSDASNNSKFVFLTKLVILTSIAFLTDIAGLMWLLLLPISPIISKFRSINIGQEMPAKQI